VFEYISLYACPGPEIVCTVMDMKEANCCGKKKLELQQPEELFERIK
jgi:hypothetical protein